MNGRSLLAVGILIAAVALPARPADDVDGLQATGRLLGHTADWVSVDGTMLAYGSGARLFLARLEGTVTVPVRERTLDAPVVEGVLVQHDLYVNRGRRIELLELDGPGVLSVGLTPEPRADLRIARLTDYLVVAEDGTGLRLVRLRPAKVMAGHEQHGPVEPVQTSFLQLDERFVAVAGAGDRAYALTAGGRLIVIDYAGGKAGLQVTELKRGGAALAASGSRLYVLGRSGLEILDLAEPERPRSERAYPRIAGSSLQLAGRMIYVGTGSGGLDTYYDQTVAGATFDVTVGDNFFSPSAVTIATCDTVRWNKSTVGQHNVESCINDQPFCAGSATEAFRSGDPTFTAFTYSHAFAHNGTHNYRCAVHAFAGMLGSVTVGGPGCNDGIACTEDTCNAQGSCAFVPNDAACSNGTVCDGVETCNAASGCQPGTPLDCVDEVECTVDSCHPVNGCMNAPDHGVCDNGDACDGAELCNPELGCESGMALDCDDGVACTTDSCDAGAGCVNVADDAACDDGVGCTVDSCDPGSGCVAAADDSACDNGLLCDGVETCDLVNDCVPGEAAADGTDCADGDVCNGDETCLSGTCTAGSALPDGDADGTCDELDDCPETPDPEQADSDEDTFGDACDCDPLDETAWAVPGEATGLQMLHTGGAAGATNLFWAAPEEPGGSILEYEVLRATSAADFAAAFICSDLPGGTESFDMDTPASGAAHFFLVRARNACDSGPAGTNSEGLPRVEGLSCP